MTFSKKIVLVITGFGLFSSLAEAGNMLGKGFLGLKAGTHNVLFAPAQASDEDQIKNSFWRQKAKVWILASFYDLHAYENEIVKAELVKGAYGFDGGDYAFEITLSRPVVKSSDAGQLPPHITLLSQSIPKQDWKQINFSAKELAKLNLGFSDIEKYEGKKFQTKSDQFILLSLLRTKRAEKWWEKTSPATHVLFQNVNGSWIKKFEDRKSAMFPVLDFDGDGLPEFYVPYADSADGNMRSLLSNFEISYSTGH